MFPLIESLIKLKWLNVVMDQVAGLLRVDKVLPQLAMFSWMLLFFHQNGVIERKEWVPVWYVFMMITTAYMISRNPYTLICITFVTFASSIGLSFLFVIYDFSRLVAFVADVFKICHGGFFVLTLVHEFVTFEAMPSMEYIWTKFKELIVWIWSSTIAQLWNWNLTGVRKQVWDFLSTHALGSFSGTLVSCLIVYCCSGWFKDQILFPCMTYLISIVASFFFWYFSCYTICVCNDNIHRSMTGTHKKWKVRDYVRFVVFTAMIVSIWHKSPPTICEVYVFNTNDKRKVERFSTKCDALNKRNEIQELARQHKNATFDDYERDKIKFNNVVMHKNSFKHSEESESYYIQYALMLVCSVGMVYLLQQDSSEM